jgi:hypothetical protein
MTVCLYLMSGCGGSSKPHIPAAAKAHPVKATAKMLVVSQPNSPVLTVSGTLVGDLDAQLTIMRNRREPYEGALKPAFTIHTSEGSITGHAHLTKFTFGSSGDYNYLTSDLHGTGIFALASSTRLSFKAFSLSQSGASYTIAMIGTLYY